MAACCSNMVLTLGTHVQQQLAKGAPFGFVQTMATTCVRTKHSGYEYDSRSRLSTTQTHFCQEPTDEAYVGARHGAVSVQHGGLLQQCSVTSGTYHALQRSSCIKHFCRSRFTRTGLATVHEHAG